MKSTSFLCLKITVRHQRGRNSFKFSLALQKIIQNIKRKPFSSANCVYKYPLKEGPSKVNSSTEQLQRNVQPRQNLYSSKQNKIDLIKNIEHNKKPIDHRKAN